MEKRKKEILLEMLIFILIIGITDTDAAYYYLFAPQFRPQKIAYIHINRDDTADSIYSKVKAQRDPRSFIDLEWVIQWRDYPRNIHTGRYATYPGENTYHVFSRLYRGYREPLNLTIGSIRTLGKLARSIGRQLMTDSAEVARTMNDSLFRHKLGYNKEAMVYLFIPETCQVYQDMSVEGFFKRMWKEHQRFWNQKQLDQAKIIDMTPEEVCTLASIVEEETNNDLEKSVVVGPYVNCLHAGVPLQVDPTVKFALQDLGLRRITNNHLTIGSPYDTYHNPGLSPGPTRIPSPIGLGAVSNHAKHNYIYMCAKKDFSGMHNFVSNHVDHMKNARKYREVLNKRKIFDQYYNEIKAKNYACGYY